MQENIILFVGKFIVTIPKSFAVYEKKTGEKYKLALLVHEKKSTKKFKGVDYVIKANLKSVFSIQKALKPYSEKIIAVTCRGEDQIQYFVNVIPNLPYVKTPTTESLVWSSDKLLMRKRFNSYNKNISPKYTIVKNSDEKTINKTAKKIGFPLIVKPSGLAGSRLVTICYHKEELQKALKNIFRKIKKVHKETGGNWEPKVLVEQFMEGTMYSIDAYIDNKGEVKFCPLVRVTTGKEIGAEDFFGYTQITPAKLKKSTIKGAEEVSRMAIKALALKNTTAHIELMRTEEGFKIIEVGARVGGFRHELYEMTYNIDHNMNDVLIRLGKKPIIPKKQKGHAAAMKFFGNKEGELIKINGLRKISKLSSFKKIQIHKKAGDKCSFARNGGLSIFNIILFHEDRSQLLADIRRLEKMINFEIK